jgi:3-methylcrotonyl-CoA carboxylase alpha subunit
MPVLQKLLIANRGEIALRIATTARRMGIRTVAVYSDADRHASFVAACDEAVYLGASPARDSYLNADALLAAVRNTGADAVHPGYGFLSENPDFASACEQAGIVFVGPPSAAIAAMGSKSAAKLLMEKAGVPLVPGYHGDDQSLATLQSHAQRIGYPVLLKASAGGGGKGMRVVREAADFAAALESCRREALNAFSDEHVLVERYLEHARHVEVQVFADTQGQTVHLFERDCSVQRRHQKVLEEAPAPGLSPQTRQAMGQAAIDAARAVGYVGAGTVEFIMEPDGRFYFMEMNTRLQVEHPVTEMITGLDLVALQLRIARGELLPFSQNDLQITGHAIELRLYAENPDQGFLPSMGVLHHVRWPGACAFVVNDQIAGDSVHYNGTPFALRLDASLRSGDEVTGFYDPMMGKLIAWGADRNTAIDTLLDALGQLQVVGLHTNAGFLKRLLADEAFRSADLDTAFIERRRDALFARSALPAGVIALAVLACERRAMGRDAHAGLGTASQWTDPWGAVPDWRLFGGVRRTWRLRHQKQTLVCDWQVNGDAAGNAGCVQWHLDGAVQMPACLPASQTTVAATDQTHTAMDKGPAQVQSLMLEMGGQRLRAHAVWQGIVLHLFAMGEHLVFENLTAAGHASASDATTGGLTAPMPGKVLAVLVKPGDAVRAGQALLVMEAMKMEHTITAPVDGVVKRVPFAVGDQVSEGVSLMELDT